MHSQKKLPSKSNVFTSAARYATTTSNQNTNKFEILLIVYKTSTIPCLATQIKIQLNKMEKMQQREGKLQIPNNNRN